MTTDRRRRTLRLEELERRQCMSIAPLAIAGPGGPGGYDETLPIAIAGETGDTLFGKIETYQDAVQPGDGPGLNLTDQQAAGVLNLDIPPAFLPPGLDEAAVPTDPTHRVGGQVLLSYQNRVIDWLSSASRPDWPFRFDVMQQVAQMPVRHAKLVLQDPDGHYITGKLNASGEFEIEWIPVAAGNATITVWSVFDAGNRHAAVGDWIGGNIDDVDDFTTDSGDYLVFSYTHAFSVADAEIADGGLDLEIVIDEDHDSAPAFHFLDNALVALDYFYDISGVHTMPKLNIVYTPDINDLEDGETGIYMPGIHPGFIYINPNFTWNGFALRHEASHVFQEHYLRNDNYGRIGEPLANVHAAAMVGGGLIDKQSELESLDVQANYLDGEFILQDSAGNYWEYHEGPWAVYDETGEVVTTINGDGDEVNVLPSSGWVQRVLWDLIDGAGSDVAEPVTSYLAADGVTVKNVGAFFDAINGGGGPGQSNQGGDHTLNDVLVHYLGGGVYGQTSDDYIDRGYDNVDIVDVLDGMVVRGHANALALSWLMNEAMDFGYYFAYMAMGPLDIFTLGEPSEASPLTKLASEEAVLFPVVAEPSPPLTSPNLPVASTEKTAERPKRLLSPTQTIDLAFASLDSDDWLAPMELAR